MTVDFDKAKEIFLAAVEQPPGEWDAFLARACNGDEELRLGVAKLLQAHRDGGSLFEHNGVVPETVLDYESIAEGPGTVIGPYKLLEKIGEGGFGFVFLAEQTGPVRRKVALKILKPGMDTRQVVARFEAERQALAIMDDPHIAKVFDGGTTPSSRPYFVMELVKGVPITQFCDEQKLPPKQRSELFLSVCHAVQHAHQKGIIHRDLKPSNVLVSRHDTTPVVKVIDFGVAKTLDQQLTDKTLFTGLDQMIGTPLYMSPEQAGLSDLDVDTRSDIYSLGVLLYELLTGSTPFDKERFKKAPYDEIRRIICEEEPPKPSTRLSASKETLPSISAQRQMEPAKLTKFVRGELDWIVMKCLEKDRQRRYETADGLAMDLQRYLDGEPVLAHPPSSVYRLRKFVRRHRGLVIGASVVAGTIILGLLAIILILSMSNDRIAQEIKAKIQERDRALNNRYALVQAVFQMLQPLDSNERRTDPKLVKIRTEMFNQAARQFQQMLKEEHDDPRVHLEIGCAFHAIAMIYASFEERQKAIDAYKVSIALLEALPDELRLEADVQNTIAKDHYNLGHELLIAGRPDEARTSFQRSITAHMHMVETVGDYRSYADTAWILGGCPFPEVRGDPAVALAMAHKALKLQQDHYNSWNTLGMAYYRADQLDQAAQALEKAMHLHPRGGEGFIWLYLAMVEWDRGNKDEARRWFQQTVDWLPQPNPGAHPVEMITLVRETATKLGVPAPTVP